LDAFVGALTPGEATELLPGELAAPRGSTLNVVR
jgi:hypothetical protein